LNPTTPGPPTSLDMAAKQDLEFITFAIGVY
jgi:hypothetical protein